ncbi:hypothetical protein [Capillimicrobium parvum]|uniref:Uncharacterized protein n=1 Tax=Capillimicrobium parvum TaxID=2884022 RepID=A0A9E7C277_9ACTN|nr:hypothetical protein [Capillimicrobium parvum]UGS37168.1 hypothetical protein DSM104329_03583 [Capillimicrobium parvum]
MCGSAIVPAMCAGFHRFALAPFARLVGGEVQLHAGDLLLPEVAASVLMIAALVAAAVLIASWWATALLFVVLVVEIVVLVATLLDILGDSGEG